MNKKREIYRDNLCFSKNTEIFKTGLTCHIIMLFVDKPGKKGKKKGSDSDSDEDWGKNKKSPGSTAKKGGGKGKGGGGGYTRALTLSPELAAIVGAEQMARHEVVRKVWSIIKERNLYVSIIRIYLSKFYSFILLSL